MESGSQHPQAGFSSFQTLLPRPERQPVSRIGEGSSSLIQAAVICFSSKCRKSITHGRIQVAPVFVLSSHLPERGFPGEANGSFCDPGGRVWTGEGRSKKLTGGTGGIGAKRGRATPALSIAVDNAPKRPMPTRLESFIPRVGTHNETMGAAAGRRVEGKTWARWS